MKKLSSLISEQKELNVINSIQDVNAFKSYVHETLSTKPGYDEDRCNMIIENLLSMYPNQYQKAIDELANFTMHR